MRIPRIAPHDARCGLSSVLPPSCSCTSNRHQWFGGDEWFILTDRGLTAGPGHLGLFEPHYEHWTTVPILAYRALYSLVGLHSYVPYIALVIVVHLATVVLLWHVMVRSEIDPWVALCFVAVFSVLGTGSRTSRTRGRSRWSRRSRSGLAAILVVPGVGSVRAAGTRSRRRLMTVAMMCSGVALPMLAQRRAGRARAARLAGGGGDRQRSRGRLRDLVPRLRSRRPCRRGRSARARPPFRLGRDHRRARRRGASRDARRRRRGRGRSPGSPCSSSVVRSIETLTGSRWRSRSVRSRSLPAPDTGAATSSGPTPPSPGYAYVTIAFVLPLVALAAQSVVPRERVATRRARCCSPSCSSSRRSASSTIRRTWPDRARTATGARCWPPRSSCGKGGSSCCKRPLERIRASGDGR